MVVWRRCNSLHSLPCLDHLSVLCYIEEILESMDIILFDWNTKYSPVSCDISPHDEHDLLLWHMSRRNRNTDVCVRPDAPTEGGVLYCICSSMFSRKPRIWRRSNPTEVWTCPLCRLSVLCWGMWSATRGKTDLNKLITR